RGLTMRTTIDTKAQQAAVQAEQDTIANPTAKQKNLKSALVAVNPHNGAVLAYYGGTGPDVKGLDGKDSYFDWASQGGRPAGSSFKPYTLATTLTQTLRQTPGADHVAINSVVDGSQCRQIAGTQICNDPGDASVSGPQVQIALAMKYSLNTTFDLLALDAGPNNVAATAHAMGVAKTDSYGNPTLVDSNGQTNFGIGIGDYPVTTIDQAVGYATLENEGISNSAYLVQSATSSDGTVVYTHQAAPKRALDAKVANDVTLTLEPIAAYSGLPLANGRASAAKTGTVGVGTNTTNNSDAWMVGYTPQVSAAVWVGSGSNQPIYNANGQPMYGKDEPGEIWQQFMNTYLANQPNLPMAATQMIAANGQSPAPSTSAAPPPSSSTPAPSSSTPKPTFSVETGFPTQPTSSAHSSSSALPPPPSTPTSTPTSPTCTPSILGPACPP
ncbi:MAG: penicillin-binding protein, partial [Actinobacteria bacterium]|nr:penicillin-binding protein [Actinomycetota bacterium]